MIFKTIRQEQDWRYLVEKEAMIVPVVMMAAEWCGRMFGKQLVLTSIHRTEMEHRDMLAGLGIAYYPTVHMYWRGVDLRSWIYTPDEIRKLETMLNGRFDYGRSKKVAVYHDIGAGVHLHLQVPEMCGVWRP